MKPFRIIWALLFSAILPGSHAQDAPQEIRHQICKTLTAYFNGYELNDTDALARAYHEQTTFTMLEEGKPYWQVLNFGEYLSAIAEHPPKVRDRVLSVQKITWTGHVAFVHTIIEYRDEGQRIHDLLLMQKGEEEWQIVNRTSLKEYATFEDRKEPPSLTGRAFTHLEASLSRLIRERKEDPHLLISAFAAHGDVSYVDPRDQVLRKLDLGSYEDLLETQQPVRRKKQETEWLFLSDQVAVVKVKTKVPTFGCHLVDYMTLVNRGGTWEIIHKATFKPERAISVVP